MGHTVAAAAAKWQRRLVRERGVVVAHWQGEWFNITKGFGFIIPDEGGPEVYLPQRKVEEAKLPRLETGTALRYSVGEERGRKFAENLSVSETAKPAAARQSVENKTVESDVDPIDDFEKEWGLRRQ